MLRTSPIILPFLSTRAHFFSLSSLICAFPGASAVNDGKTGVLIGSWDNRRDWLGNGIKITTDAGQTWKQYNGNIADIPARYGCFLSKDAGYVTSSTFPGDTASNLRELARTNGRYTLTRHLSLGRLHASPSSLTWRRTKRLTSCVL